ncbi:unnamed protein product [Clonostachys solani]|uniref:Uncharacterized protein n=1 Tax=Clonostachys solani TaxID=160281 RepID=A0A9N9YV99_9HYPO|nr:unnamed protein product [Clonostachys solani]
MSYTVDETLGAEERVLYLGTVLEGERAAETAQKNAEDWEHDTNVSDMTGVDNNYTTIVDDYDKTIIDNADAAGINFNFATGADLADFNFDIDIAGDTICGDDKNHQLCADVQSHQPVINTTWSVTDTESVQSGNDMESVQPGTETELLPGTDTECLQSGNDTESVQPGTDTECLQPGTDTECLQPGTAGTDFQHTEQAAPRQEQRRQVSEEQRLRDLKKGQAKQTERLQWCRLLRQHQQQQQLQQQWQQWQWQQQQQQQWQQSQQQEQPVPSGSQMYQAAAPQFNPQQLSHPQLAAYQPFYPQQSQGLPEPCFQQFQGQASRTYQEQQGQQGEYQGFPQHHFQQFQGQPGCMASNTEDLPPYQEKQPIKETTQPSASATNHIINRIAGTIQTGSIRDFQVDYLTLIRDSATSYHVSLTVDPTPLYHIKLISSFSKVGNIQIFSASDSTLPIAAARLSADPTNKREPLATICTCSPTQPNALWVPMTAPRMLSFDYKVNLPIVTVPGRPAAPHLFKWYSAPDEPKFDLRWAGALPIVLDIRYHENNYDSQFMFATVVRKTAGGEDTIVEIRRWGGIEFELGVILGLFVVAHAKKIELL